MKYVTMKKYIISGLIISTLINSHLNWAMIRISPSRLQQSFTTQAGQTVPTSAYRKFMPKIIPTAYNYGKQKTKTVVNYVLKTWNHPLYKDFFEPLYVGLELQHGWIEKKYKQLMWLKKQFQSDDQETSPSQNDTPKYPTQLKQRYAANPLQHIPPHTLKLYAKAMKRYEHAYQRFMDHKDNPDDFFDYQELQNATDDLYLIMNQIQEILETATKEEQDISDILPEQDPIISDTSPVSAQTSTSQGPKILPPD